VNRAGATPHSRPGGILYLVGTPIGNREDLAPRARRVLEGVDVVACEDTRVARTLFGWLGLEVPQLVAYHEHNVERALPVVLARLAAGNAVALVSDAGMPALQDPGYRLVRAARERDLRVVPIPGPTAALLALAASGLPTDRFTFLGFAPRRGREAWWDAALRRGETLLVYEAPTRAAGTLARIADHAPERPVCLARELTKLHEEFVSGTAREVAEELAGRSTVRGECVLVVAGCPESTGSDAVEWRAALAAIGETRAGRALSARDRVELLACVYPGERNAIYRAVHEKRA